MNLVSLINGQAGLFQPLDPLIEEHFKEKDAKVNIYESNWLDEKWVEGSETINFKKLFLSPCGEDDYYGWLDGKAMAFAWKDPEKPRKEVSWAFKRSVTASPKNSFKAGDHINPSHYQGHFVSEALKISLQWLETQSGIMSPERFEGGLEMMTRKYIDRRGGKDAEIQELKKSLWYLKFWIAYLTNNRKMTTVKEVEELINK